MTKSDMQAIEQFNEKHKAVNMSAAFNGRNVCMYVKGHYKGDFWEHWHGIDSCSQEETKAFLNKYSLPF